MYLLYNKFRNPKISHHENADLININSIHNPYVMNMIGPLKPYPTPKQLTTITGSSAIGFSCEILFYLTISYETVKL